MRRDQESFYGWTVVGLTFATQLLIAGCIFYSLAIVLTDLAEEFSQGRRAPILGLQLAMGLSSALMAPFIGRLVGRGHIRSLMVAGAISAGVGLIALAHASALWQLIAVFGTLLAFGANTLAGITVTTIVVNWFDRRRAMALAASQLGASAGGVVVAPIFAAIVAASDWRAAYETLGIVFLCATAPIAWLTVGRPEDLGQAADGIASDEDRTRSSNAEGDGEGRGAAPFRTRDALKQTHLWLIAVATGFAFMATSALLNNIVAYGTDAGFSAASAAWLVSIVAAGAASGKLLFGWLADRIGAANAFSISLAGEALGLVSLTQGEAYGLVVGLVFLTGVVLGGALPLSSALLAEAFGRDRFAPMMGLMMPLAIPLQLLGPIFAGWVYDSTGSYSPAFLALAAVLIVAAALVRGVRTHRNTSDITSDNTSDIA